MKIIDEHNQEQEIVTLNELEQVMKGFTQSIREELSITIKEIKEQSSLNSIQVGDVIINSFEPLSKVKETIKELSGLKEIQLQLRLKKLWKL